MRCRIARAKRAIEKRHTAVAGLVSGGETQYTSENSAGKTHATDRARGRRLTLGRTWGAEENDATVQETGSRQTKNTRPTPYAASQWGVCGGPRTATLLHVVDGLLQDLIVRVRRLVKARVVNVERRARATGQQHPVVAATAEEGQRNKKKR